jgi:hypothetical protein
MAYASAWTDLIKSSETESMQFGKTVFHKCPAFDLNRDCTNKTCIVTAIANYAIRAMNASLSHTSGSLKIDEPLNYSFPL